jgi:hypothetical protein
MTVETKSNLIVCNIFVTIFALLKNSPTNVTIRYFSQNFHLRFRKKCGLNFLIFLQAISRQCEHGFEKGGQAF